MKGLLRGPGAASAGLPLAPSVWSTLREVCNKRSDKGAMPPDAMGTAVTTRTACRFG